MKETQMKRFINVKLTFDEIQFISETLLEQREQYPVITNAIMRAMDGTRKCDQEDCMCNHCSSINDCLCHSCEKWHTCTKQDCSWG